MNKDMKITLRLNADGRAMVTSVRQADKALGDLGNTAERQVSRTRRGLDSISTQLANTRRQILGFFAVKTFTHWAADALSAADNVKLMNARLLQATGSQQAYNAARAEAAHIASVARADYESTVNLLSRITTAANQYHIEQSKIAATTAAVTYGLKLYGATGAEVASVQTQLSQALASGVLAGDEFKSMAEASPRLMQALADGIGVARGELKAMAADSKLTTEVVINALAGQADALGKEFAAMPLTVNEAIGQMTNAISQKFDEFDQLYGITDSIAQAILSAVEPVTKGIEFLFENLDELSEGFLIAAASAGVFYGVHKLQILTITIGQMIALERALGGVGSRAAIVSLLIKQFGTASGRAAASVRALNLAIMANPLGLLIGGLSMAIGYLVAFRHKIHPVGDSIASLGDYASVAFDFIRDTISDALKWLGSLIVGWDTVGEAIADLLGISSETWSAIGGLLSDFLSWVKGVVNKFIGLFVGAYEAIKAMWGNFPNALNGIVVDAVNWALEGINRFVRGSAELLNKIPGVEIDISTLGFTKLVNEAEGAAESVYAAFSKGFNADHIGNAASAVGEKFNAVVQDVLVKYNEIGDLWTDLAEAKTYQRLNDPLNDMEDNASDVTTEIKKIKESVTNTAGALGDLGKSGGEVAKKTAKEIDQFTNKLDGLLAQLFPGKKLLHDMQNEAKMLSRAMGGDGTNALKKYGVSAEQVSTKLTSLQKIIKGMSDGSLSKEAAKKQFDELKKGIEDVEDKAESTTDVITEQFKRAVESIDQSFANMWKSVLSGGEISFKSLADSAKNILAEVLHGVTTKPLTGWLTGLFSVDKKTVDGDKVSPVKKLSETFTDGYEKLGKTFSDGLGELLGVEDKNNKALVGFGKAMAGAVVGAGIGGTVGGLIGGDAGIASIGGAAGGALGQGVVSLFDIGSKFLSTAIPIVGSVIGSLIGGLLSRKKDKISRSVVTSDGSVTRNQTNDIKSSVSQDIAKQFWEGATSRANQYGVGFAKDLATMVTYKTHRKGNGPMMWYFDLIKDTNRDGEGDQTLFNSSFQSSEKDPEKIAQAMAQMQIAALATADWSGVSATIAEGMSIVSAEGMSTQQIEAFYTWMDRTMLITKAFGVEIGSVGDNLGKFGGSFEAFQTYTTATYDLITRYGKGMVDDLTSYLKNTPDADWADTAQSLNVVTYGMELLGQKSFATNKQLIKSAAGITKSFGGAESAMKTYQAIFAATATETHKAGIAYQSHKQRVDLLNQSMGFAGETYIGTTEQLAAFVAGLNPLSDSFAENMRWAGQMSNSLLGVADASKYFTSAIEGINQTISGVVTGIREDLMTSEELYNSRKSQAESLAASIASMTDVSAIESAAKEASAIVNNMWRSLSDEQQTAGVGDWMISYLNELETLAQGRITAIQNEYGADNNVKEGYEEVEAAAIDMSAMFDAAAKQQEAAQQQSQAGKTMDKAAGMMDKAAAVMSNAANLINKPVDVDVTVHQVAIGGEIN